MSSAAASTTIAMARPSPAPMSALRWLPATYTPPASSSSIAIGSTILRSLMTRYPVCALVRYFAENSGNVGLIGGSLLTIVRPLAASRCFAMSISGPRFSVTSPFCTVIHLLPSPDSAFTSCAWAFSLTRTQALANAWLLTTLLTWVWMNPVTAPAIDGPNAFSALATLDSPLPASALAAWLVYAVRLRLLLMLSVILSVSAPWIAGLLASGATFST
jgi:hypothetical protein